MNLWEPEIGQRVSERRSLECPYHKCLACGYEPGIVQKYVGVIVKSVSDVIPAHCIKCGNQQFLPGHCFSFLKDNTSVTIRVAASELGPVEEASEEAAKAS